MLFGGYKNKKKESTKKQQTYEAKPNLGKNCAINFHVLKNQEFLPLLKDYKKKWIKNYCDGGLVIVESLYP